MEWRTITTHPDYDVSASGLVRSRKKGKSRIMKSSICDKGYRRLRLMKEGVGKMFRVHQLVAKAFIPNPDNLPEIDHINRVKTDNQVENLRWVTTSTNSLNKLDRPSMYGRNIHKNYIGFQVKIVRNQQIVYHRHFGTLEEAIAFRDSCLEQLK